MKKLILVLVLVIVSVATVSAMGFYATPSAALNLGINNYFRGGAVGGQLFMDLGFIALGLEAKVGYDVIFGNVNVPFMLLLGFGRNFWIGAGYTMGVTPMATSGAAWSYGSFPNTYALGFNLLSFPLGFGTLVIPTEVTYTQNGPVDIANPIAAAIGGIAGFLLGLQASLGVGLEMKL